MFIISSFLTEKTNMKPNLLKSAILLIAFFLVTDATFAEINKCTTPSGKIEYRDGPCEAKETSKTLAKKRENAQEPSQSARIHDNFDDAPPTAAPSAPAPGAPPAYRFPQEQRTKRSKLPNDQSIAVLR